MGENIIIDRLALVYGSIDTDRWMLICLVLIFFRHFYALSLIRTCADVNATPHVQHTLGHTTPHLALLLAIHTSTTLFLFHTPIPNNSVHHLYVHRSLQNLPRMESRL